MILHDGATPLARRRTPEGFLHLKARIGRAGLQSYRAAEIGGPPGAEPDRIVRVYRPPDEVFDAASQGSFAGKPVTSDHPPGMIDSANWRQFAVGHAGGAVVRDGDHLATDLTITDAAAVARAEAGAELSNGYWADIHFEPGVTPDGEPYDAVQRNIRGNHIAIVEAGRCGPTCRIGAADVLPENAARDCACGGECTVTIDGAAFGMAPEAAAAVEALQGRLAAALADADRKAAAQMREIAALAATPPDPDRLDALVVERAAVLDAARAVLGAGFDPRGRSVAAVRRAAVERLLGAERVRGRDDAYVAAAFDALAAAAHAANPLGSQLSAARIGAGSREAALAARNAHLVAAWKGDSNGVS